MTDTTQQRARGQNRETILKAITDLTEHGHQASRRRIVEVTGLSMGIVDDHISRLRENGLIRSLYAGLFELVDTTPVRLFCWRLNHQRLLDPHALAVGV